MIQIDGITWSVPCEIHRISEISPSEISGMLLDRSYYADVLGTYLRYEVGIAAPITARAAYDQLYDALTAPVGWHSMVLPYAQDTVTLIARVENVKDTLYQLSDGGAYWEGCTFTAIGCTPLKTMGLTAAISYGLPPWPQGVTLPLGSTWQYTASGWVRYTPPSYTNADNIYY